jgi:large subunit ribosomal protein L13
MKTYVPKEGEFERGWKVFDAEGKILGRLATEVADTLRGKNKPNFTPHVDTGDFVVIVNADKIRLTGKKLSDKVYYHHTGYPGGIKSITAEKLLEKKPEQLLIKAINGMLPKNKLQKRFMKKLKIYAGAAHPHQAQKPETVAV